MDVYKDRMERIVTHLTKLRDNPNPDPTVVFPVIEGTKGKDMIIESRVYEFTWDSRLHDYKTRINDLYMTRAFIVRMLRLLDGLPREQKIFSMPCPQKNPFGNGYKAATLVWYRDYDTWYFQGF